MASKRKLAPMYKTDRAVHRLVTREFLDRRVGNGKYGRSVWVRYCDVMLDQGYAVEIYEAKDTVSKYITVTGNFDITYKVRFSNHPPSYVRMLDSDVNMVVGYSRDGIRWTLEDAIIATLKWFDVDNERARESNRETSGKLGEEAAYQNEEERDRRIIG